MQNVTVATFNQSEPAQRVKERLGDEGIEARVLDQRALQRVWFLAKPYSAFHLVVPKENFDQAAGLLELWHNEDGLLRDALRCPECGSLQIEYPQMTRKFVLPTLVAHVLVWCGLMEREFYCEECHHTWKSPGTVGSKPVHLPHPSGV